MLHGTLVAWLTLAAPAVYPQVAVKQNLARSYNTLGFNLLAELRRENADQNIFISPAGLAFALAMAADCAGGVTLQEMRSVLHVPPALQDLNAENAALVRDLLSARDRVKLEIANSLWAAGDIHLNADYVEAMRSSFQAEVASVNFHDSATAKTINDWVSQHTAGKIPSMVDPPLDGNRLILLDAIYFKGTWATPFDRKLTKDGPFTLANGQTVERPRMIRTDHFPYFENELFQAVSLPYAGGDLAMYVFLPRKSLPDLLSNLTMESWARWTAPFISRRGTVALPRFKLQNEYDLKTPLMAMGMQEAFAERADFHRLSSDPLYIDWIRQKTFVEVNEEGTEAAAVTGIGFKSAAVRREPPPFEMIVDRPFLFAIRENRTGAILFLGAITNPP
jgi:serpin B